MVNLDIVKLGLKQNSIWTSIPGDLFNLKVMFQPLTSHMQILGEFKGSGVDFLLCYLKSSLVTVQMHKVLVRQLKYETKKEKSYRCRYSSVAYQRFYWKYSSLPNDSKKKELHSII